MTVIRTRSRRQRKNGGAVGHWGDDGALVDVLGLPRRGRVKRYGERSTFDRERSPLTEQQAIVFDALGDDPQAPAALAKLVGLTGAQVGSALYYLSSKSLAIKTAGGWMREPEHASEAA